MYRILLVDDEPNILNALRRLLSRLKPDDLNGEYFVIDTYASPEEALERADEVRIDLAISDYRMPGMNGVEFLKKLIAKQPDVARLCEVGQQRRQRVRHARDELVVVDQDVQVVGRQ